MAISLYTVTGNAADVLGGTFRPSGLRVIVSTNLPPGEAPIDLEHNRALLGGAIVKPSGDGSFTIPNLIGHDSADVNPTGIQYRFDLDYVDITKQSRSGQQAIWSSGWVSITADADLADLVAEQYAPPNYQSAFLEQAEAIRDQQVELSGIDSSDTATAYNIAHGTATKDVLTASIDAIVDPVIAAEVARSDETYSPISVYALATRGFAPKVAPVAKMVSSLGAAGHGWTAIGTPGSSNLNDTSSFVLGTQSGVIVTNGAGAASSFDKTGLAVDATGKFVRLWLAVDDLAKMNTATLYLGDATLANNKNGQILNGPGFRETQQFLRSGEWAVLDVPWTDLTSTTGTPDRAAIARARLTFADRSGGAVAVRLGAIAFVDEPSAWPSGVVSFTFDDNPVSQYTVARPYLDKYGYAGTLYPIIDRIGTAGQMTLAQMKQLQNFNGWDFGAHASTLARHVAGFQAMTEAELVTEFETIRTWMNANGLRGESFAWPNGDSSTLAETVCGRYFRSARSTYTRTHEVLPPTYPYRLKAVNATTLSLAQLQAHVDQAKVGKCWVNFIFHDIVTTPAALNDVSTANFQGLVDYVNTQNVPARTVSQVLGTS